MARPVKVPLTDNQFAALVSFDFNTGAIAGEKQASFVRAMNPGDYDAERPGLMQWVKSKKKDAPRPGAASRGRTRAVHPKHARNGVLSPIEFERQHKATPEGV